MAAASLVLMLPETLNKRLPQTTEDTEQMGLTWYVLNLILLFAYFHLSSFSFHLRHHRQEMEMDEQQLNTKKNTSEDNT